MLFCTNVMFFVINLALTSIQMSVYFVCIFTNSLMYSNVTAQRIVSRDRMSKAIRNLGRAQAQNFL